MLSLIICNLHCLYFDTLDVGDIVSQSEIKKEYRNVIFVEDGNGNLIKYVRAETGQKPKRKPKPNGNAKPIDNTNSNGNAKPVPSAVVSEPLKPYEREAKRMTACSVNLHCMTEEEIGKELAKLKRESKIIDIKKKLKDLPMLTICEFVRYASIVEPDLRLANGGIDFGAVADDRLKLMEEHMFRIESQFIEPLWQNVLFNPLHEPMFVLGDQWKFDFDCNFNLIIHLPEIDGKREKFIVSAAVWMAWIGYNSNNMDFQSSVELPSTQNEIADENISNNNSLSLLDINTNDIAKLLGENGDEMMAAFFATSCFLDFGQAGFNISNSSNKANDSTIKSQSILSENDDAYDASYETDY